MTPNEKTSKINKDDKGQKNSDENGGKTPRDDKVLAAHDQAEADIKKDPDLTLARQADDLDEEESVRLRGNKNDLA